MDVSEDAYLFSLNGYPFQGANGKQLQAEDDVGIVSGSRAIVCTLGQGIELPHTPSWFVVQGEVKVGKVQEPPSLAMVELLGRPEVFQVLVVCPNFKLVPRTFQEVTPLLQGPDDGQHLIVVNLVIVFHGIEAFGVEGHRVPLLVLRGLLRQDCTSCEVRAVGLDAERTVVVGEDEDRLGGDGRLQSIKSPLLCIPPGPSYVLSSEVKQQPCVVGEVLDEPLVEVGEPQEGLYFLLVLGLWLLGYASHLHGVQLRHAMRDDQPKILDAGLFKLALLRFEVELVQAETIQDDFGDATMLL
ncbi:hypothetical protein C0992_003658 [Termitomyces sp. T32_za158]|nr:hypothetical protein C0992_003658 [Termitomyces sp. T32_za158]